MRAASPSATRAGLRDFHNLITRQSVGLPRKTGTNAGFGGFSYAGCSDPMNEFQPRGNMMRQRRKAVRPSGARRQRRKNYDDSDEFDSVDFGPGDQPVPAVEPTLPAE